MKNVILSIAITAFYLSLPLEVFAKDDDPLFIGGFQRAEHNSYTYAGLITPILGGKLGEGWFNRTIASWLTYEYDTSYNGQPTQLKAKAPGIETGFGYAWAGKSYGVNISASVGYRDFRLSPNVAGEEPEGKVLVFSPQLQARYDITEHIETDLIASHAFAKKNAETSFARLRLGYKPRWDWKFGIEGIYQEGENFRVKQQGLYVVTYLKNGWGVEASGGNAESRDNSSSAYIGFGVSKQF